MTGLLWFCFGILVMGLVMGITDNAAYRRVAGEAIYFRRMANLLQQDYDDLVSRLQSYEKNIS